jgi:predicted RNA-binding Zn-ribbon protein involved in translation (DUF1610 family)
MANDKHSQIFFVFAIPLYALYGAWVLFHCLSHFVRWVARTLKLEAGHLECPACGSSNSIFGRWECGAPGCGAVYLGNVGRFLRCHAGTSFFACDKCGDPLILRPGR